MGKRLAIVIGVAAAGVMLAVPALAGQTVKSTITVDDRPKLLLKGSVESRKHACEVDRRVKLFFKGEGFNGDLAGSDTSNRHGVWKIPISGGHFYYARVVRSKEDTAGTTFVCGGDRTKRIDTH